MYIHVFVMGDVRVESVAGATNVTGLPTVVLKRALQATGLFVRYTSL